MDLALLMKYEGIKKKKKNAVKEDYVQSTNDEQGNTQVGKVGFNLRYSCNLVRGTSDVIFDLLVEDSTSL